MPTIDQIQAQQDLANTAYGQLHSINRFMNGEPVIEETWNSRSDLEQARIDKLHDLLREHENDFNNSHTVTLAQVLAADNTTIVPTNQIDANLVRQAQLVTATSGLVNSATRAWTIIDEVIEARDTYTTLNDRLDAIVAASINQAVVDLYSAKPFVTTSWAGTLAVASFPVTFTAGVYYRNGIRYLAPASYTFASRPSLTTVYLFMNNSGTLLEFLNANDSNGTFIGTATVDPFATLTWIPASPLIEHAKKEIFRAGIVVIGDIDITGNINGVNINNLALLKHKHYAQDCSVTGNNQIWDLPVTLDPANPNVSNIEIYRNGVEVRPTDYSINNLLKQVTFTDVINTPANEWIRAKWINSGAVGVLGGGFVLGGGLVLGA